MQSIPAKITLKNFFLFSTPSILSCLVEPLAAMVDTILVSRYSTSLLASLALGASLTASFTWIFNFLLHVTVQNVSSAIGKNEPLQILQRVKLSLILALLVSALSTGLLILLKEQLYSLIGVTNELRPILDKYYSMRLWGQPFQIIFITVLANLQAFAQLKLSFLIITLATILNIILSYCALYLMDLGLTGVAFATSFSQAFAFCLALVFLLLTINNKVMNNKGTNKKATSFMELICLGLKLKVDITDALGFSKRSGFIFLRSLFLMTAFFLSTRFATNLGVKVLAAHQILLQFWLLVSYITDGFATSTNLWGARLVAQKKQILLKKLRFVAVLCSFVLGFFACVVMYLFKDLLLSFYTEDVEVLTILNSIWLLLVLIQIPNTISFIYDGLMFGIDKFTFISIQMMIGFFIVYLPIALQVFNDQSLFWIWAALSAINIYRMLTNHFEFNKFIKTSLKGSS